MKLDEDALQDRAWSFGVAGAEPYARYIRLAAGGRVGGLRTTTEASWSLEDGFLVFRDHIARPTTVFTSVASDEHGRLHLQGRFLLSDTPVMHELRERKPPHTLSAPCAEMDLSIKRQRRNLVILRANDKSCHFDWIRDIEYSARDWDLCISWYGSSQTVPLSLECEYLIIQNEDYKFPAIHKLLHVDSPLWLYEYHFLPDDDLAISWSAINRMFAVCREFQLQLAQPALIDNGNVNYPILKVDHEKTLRFISFVELMAPIFSRDALRACAPTFGASPHGFGLDNIWPKLIGEPRTGVAVIDDAPVVHTRPLAGAGWYDLATAVREGNELQALYNAPSIVKQYGSIVK